MSEDEEEEIKLPERELKKISETLKIFRRTSNPLPDIMKIKNDDKSKDTKEE